MHFSISKHNHLTEQHMLIVIRISKVPLKPRSIQYIYSKFYLNIGIQTLIDVFGFDKMLDFYGFLSDFYTTRILTDACDL